MMPAVEQRHQPAEPRKRRETAMTSEKNTQIFRRVVEEGFNKGNLDALDALFAPDFQEHQPGMVPPNLEGVKGAITYLRSVFPDLTLTIEDSIANSDTVWARITARGTQRGAFMGQPPSERTFAITVIDIARFADGKMIEHWGVPDRFDQMEQLGVLRARP
jgi:predicted ester cyclase